MVLHGKLTLNGSAQSLALAFPNTNVSAACWMSLQADAGNAGVIYVGGSGSSAPSSSSYGFRIEIPVSSIPQAPSIFEFPRALISIGDLNVIGTNNDIIHVMLVVA